MFWMTDIWDSTGRYRALLRDCHAKKPLQSEWVSVPTQNGARRPWGASPRHFPAASHSKQRFHLPGGRGGIQTLKIEKCGNKCEEQKKMKKTVLSVVFEIKHAVFKAVTFSKRPSEKQVISFLRSHAWQVWLEKVPRRTAFSLGMGPAVLPTCPSHPSPAAKKAFFRLPLCMPLLQSSVWRW